MSAYYNEFDRYPAQWLRNLSDRKYIAPGVVDERSIKAVVASDVRGATQSHFFAGIGVWSYALRLAGWPDDFGIWTGSCPCQPFSSAGQGKGLDDPRHLWPDWYRLIKECRPQCLAGEQSSSPDALIWFDLVSSQLEAIGYTVGACITNSARVGAPHIRHRLYFVAHTEEFRWPARGDDRESARLDEAWQQFERHGDARLVADAYRARFAGQPGSGSVPRAEGEVPAWVEGAHRVEHGGSTDELADPLRAGWAERGTEPRSGSPAGSSCADELADADGERFEGERLLVRERGSRQDLPEAPRSGEVDELADAAGGGREEAVGNVRARQPDDGRSGATDGLVHAASVGRGQDRLSAADSDAADRGREADQRGDAGAADGMGDTSSARGGRDAGAVLGAQGEGPLPWFATGRVAHLPVVAGAARLVGDAQRAGLQEQLWQRRVPRAAGGDGAGEAAGRAGSPTGGFWTDAVWIYCRDGKYRSAESRVVALDDGPTLCLDFVRPLERGVEGRVGKIKAFGNAINALQAAAFIRSFIEVAQHL